MHSSKQPCSVCPMSATSTSTCEGREGSPTRRRERLQRLHSLRLQRLQRLQRLRRLRRFRRPPFGSEGPSSWRASASWAHIHSARLTQTATQCGAFCVAQLGYTQTATPSAPFDLSGRPARLDQEEGTFETPPGARRGRRTGFHTRPLWRAAADVRLRQFLKKSQGRRRACKRAENEGRTCADGCGAVRGDA